jgi:hypothetical protein
MAVEIKDFIKFIAEVLVILMIFMVVFTPEGIASNTYNFLTYAEPILLQDWLSTAITVGSNSPGEFFTTIKTSGNPYTIKIYTTDITYVSVIPSQESYMKTTYASLEPVPVVTNCIINDKEIKLQKNLIQIITVRKIVNDSTCIIYVNTTEKLPEPVQPPTGPPPQPTCACTAWRREETAMCGEPPCTPDQVKYIRNCDPVGCDPGDGMGESQCIIDTSCTESFDFSVSANPDSGVVNRGLGISTRVGVDILKGVSELVSLSTLNLPSATTTSFEFLNYYPPGQSNMTILTTSNTPKGTHTITIKGNTSTLIKTTTYNLSVIESGGCCPIVQFNVFTPDPAQPDILTVRLRYWHDVHNGGAVHLHWPTNKAKFISLSSSVSDTIYLPNSWNPSIMNGNDLVECGSDTNRMSDGDTCNITLQALDGDINFYYRAWDWNNNNVCGGIIPSRINQYDYDRDPNSGTCSLNCDVFLNQVILCDTDTIIVPITLIGSLHVNATLDGNPTAANVIVVDKSFNKIGDCTWDGFIGMGDKSCVNAHWHNPPDPDGLLGYSPDADFNGDGKVNNDDMAIINANWGKTAPTYITEFTIQAVVGKAVLYGTNPTNPTDIQIKEINVLPPLIDVQFDFIS